MHGAKWAMRPWGPAPQYPANISAPGTAVIGKDTSPSESRFAVKRQLGARFHIYDIRRRRQAACVLQKAMALIENRPV